MNNFDIVTNNSHSDSVLINEVNVGSGILLNNLHLLRNAKCWHKFIVSNTEGLTRDEILKTILDHVHPLDLIPVFFSKDNTNSTSFFLARNCEAAIKKLCDDNLFVDHPYNKDSGIKHFTCFRLNIILNYSNTNEIKIDVQKNVLYVLQNRLNSKTLDLDKFAQDPKLTEYCPLSQPKIMYFVLHIAKTLSPEEIILSNNGIKLLNPIDVLFSLKLKALDLTNNEIASFDDLNPLKHFYLKELKLSGNPLCMCDEYEYISKVKSLCSTVEFLDGMPLNLGKFPVSRRNFLCDDNSFDLVNQFLEHFFTIYDSKDRRLLYEFYHNEAIFSMTTLYLANQVSSKSASLGLYRKISRNLKKTADVSKTTDLLYQGRDSILSVLLHTIPESEHDPYSFTTDLIYKTDRNAIIVVTGVFHELTSPSQDQLIGFSRTFNLEILDHGAKCVIKNEQLHVYNALTYQEANCFQDPITHTKQIIPRSLMQKAESTEDYYDLIYTLSCITNLNKEWAKKCLEECDYDLKKSLELFVDLYKVDKIPQHAFIESNFDIAESQKSKPVFPITHLNYSDNIPTNNSIEVQTVLNKMPNYSTNVMQSNVNQSQPLYPGSKYIKVAAEKNGLEIYEFINSKNKAHKNNSRSQNYNIELTR